MVAGPTLTVEISGRIQIIRVVALMDADYFLFLVSGKKGLDSFAFSPRLENFVLMIILAKGVIAHVLFYRDSFFCQMKRRIQNCFS